MKLILLSLILVAQVFASGSNDPHFPPTSTVGKNVRASHPNTNVDKDFVGNFYSQIPSGTKFNNFELLNLMSPCVEANGAYYKYSVTVDKPTVTTKYFLVSAVAGQPPLGTATHPGFDAIAIGKPAPQNAVTFLPGNSINDCHTVVTSINSGSDFFISCNSCYSIGCSSSSCVQACFAEQEALAVPGAGKTAHCGDAT